MLIVKIMQNMKLWFNLKEMWFIFSEYSCFQQGKKNDGNEIDKQDADNSCQCQARCQSRSDCVAFDYKDNKDCSLKSTVGSLHDDKHKVAGLKNCPTPSATIALNSGGKQPYPTTLISSSIYTNVNVQSREFLIWKREGEGERKRDG